MYTLLQEAYLVCPSHVIRCDMKELVDQNVLAFQASNIVILCIYLFTIEHV